MQSVTIKMRILFLTILANFSLSLGEDKGRDPSKGGWQLAKYLAKKFGDFYTRGGRGSSQKKLFSPHKKTNV